MLERELGAWRTSKFDDSGTAESIPGSHFSEIQDRNWTLTCADGLDGSAGCMGCEQFLSKKDMGERHIVVFVARTPLEKLCRLEKCARCETILRMEPN